MKKNALERTRRRASTGIAILVFSNLLARGRGERRVVRTVIFVSTNQTHTHTHTNLIYIHTRANTHTHTHRHDADTTCRHGDTHTRKSNFAYYELGAIHIAYERDSQNAANVRARVRKTGASVLAF